MAEFEERADQLTLEMIDSSLVDSDMFRKARRQLLGSGAKLLVGPRGVGKTHLMRYTYQHALNTQSAPLVLYASFSRYLHLEPLLKRSPDAIKRFHSWVVARLLLSCFDWLRDSGNDNDATCLASTDERYNHEKLKNLIAWLERNSGDEIYEEFGQYLTVDLALRATEILANKFKRKRVVFLLDDAALSLTDQYLIAFFEIFRLLKTQQSSPKASVYPGTTQYGPTFHVAHEAEFIPLWLSIEDSGYLDTMEEIAVKRFPPAEVEKANKDAIDLFKYVSFGIPRTFLRLLREYLNLSHGTPQQNANKIIEEQTDLISAEYDSLKLKMPQFASLVAMGWQLFSKAVNDVAAAQRADLSSRNVILGIKQDKIRDPLSDRMLRLLVEVGLMFQLNAVSHGPDRKYDRYIPHLAFLYQQGAFREGRRASLGGLAEVMRRAPQKQPVRRDIGSLVGKVAVSELHLDLPPCPSCGAVRLNESQRFCHQCGHPLPVASSFEKCMELPLEEVPGISAALIRRIHEDTPLRTIKHVYASQDPSGDLQRAKYVGKVRAKATIQKISILVDEFLS